jgi:hypothetical protein
MLAATEPQTTEALVAQIEPPKGSDDPILFGLYLGLRQHRRLFHNTTPDQQPHWVLAGPPPGPFTPHYAAYDPASYEILCRPGHEMPPALVERLWQLELLAAVVT